MPGDKVVDTVTGNRMLLFKFLKCPKTGVFRTQSIAPSGSIFKKSSRGQMYRLFYRNLTLCPREDFLKMLPEGAILWVRKTPVLGHL